MDLDTTNMGARVGTSPKIRMDDAELSAFLAEERVLRLATVDEQGWPAVVPVWFVWHDGAIWVNNLDRADRTPRLQAGGRVGVCVDAGEEYAELRGVTARVQQQFLDDDEVPEEVRLKMGRKYFHMDQPLPIVDDHTWMRLDLVETQTWDFRKVHGG